MKLNNLILLLEYIERTVVVIGYLYGNYYLFNITAPFASKTFVFFLITLVFVVYIRQVLKKSKLLSEKIENSSISKPQSILSYSTLKYSAVISLIGVIFLTMVIVYEVFVLRMSSYFPLKLMADALLYSVLKNNLKRLASFTK